MKEILWLERSRRKLLVDQREQFYLLGNDAPHVLRVREIVVLASYAIARGDVVDELGQPVVTVEAVPGQGPQVMIDSGGRLYPAQPVPGGVRYAAERYLTPQGATRGRTANAVRLSHGDAMRVHGHARCPVVLPQGMPMHEASALHDLLGLAVLDHKLGVE